MPLENDFTRVFGAIKELADRVQSLEVRSRLDKWNVFLEQEVTPIPTSGSLVERIKAETLIDNDEATVDLDDWRELISDYETLDRKTRRLEESNNQLRFILSILAAVKDDGWIEWHGGRVPPVFDLVDCKLRDGWTWKRINPDRLSWAHNSWGTDIIAYRIAR